MALQFSPNVLSAAEQVGPTRFSKLPVNRLQDLFRRSVEAQAASNFQTDTPFGRPVQLGGPALPDPKAPINFIGNMLGVEGLGFGPLSEQDKQRVLSQFNSLSEEQQRQLFDVGSRFEEFRRQDSGPLGFLTKPEFAIPAIVGGGLALGLSGAGAGGGSIGANIGGTQVGATAPTAAGAASGAGAGAGSALSEIDLATLPGAKTTGVSGSRLADITQIANQSLSGVPGGSALTGIDKSTIAAPRQLPAGIGPDRLAQIEQIAQGGGGGLFDPTRTAATTGGRKALEEIDTSQIPDQRSLPPGVSPERAAQIAEIAGGSGVANGLFGLGSDALSGLATAGTTLLGGLMGNDAGQQSITQRTELPPEFSRALNFLLDEGINLAQGTTPLTPALSDPTMQGIDFLQQENPLLRNELNQLALGQGTSRIEDAISQAATRAVGDRFSQAGRTGSPGEALSLGRTVSRELAPFAFGAQQSALNQLMRMDQQRGQNFLTAGGILEEQQRQRALDPFTRLQLASSPITAAIGGAPTISTTTQPVNRNRAAGALGGSLLGSEIGGQFDNPFAGAIGAGLGGLLGGFL